MKWKKQGNSRTRVDVLFKKKLFNVLAWEFSLFSLSVFYTYWAWFKDAFHLILPIKFLTKVKLSLEYYTNGVHISGNAAKTGNDNVVFCHIVQPNLPIYSTFIVWLSSSKPKLFGEEFILKNESGQPPPLRMWESSICQSVFFLFFMWHLGHGITEGNLFSNAFLQIGSCLMDWKGDLIDNQAMNTKCPPPHCGMPIMIRTPLNYLYAYLPPGTPGGTFAELL